MRGAEGDAAIDPARPAELLEVHARYQASQTMAHQVDSSAAHTPLEEVPQLARCPLNAIGRLVVKAEELLHASCAQISDKRQERAAVAAVAVHQHHRALRGPAGGALALEPPAKWMQKQEGGGGSHLARDQDGRGLLGGREVFRHPGSASWHPPRNAPGELAAQDLASVRE